MSMFRLLGSAVFGRQHRTFLKACKNPDVAQALAWSRIRKLLSQGEVWPRRRADFSISRLEAMPISDYEDYRAVLEAAIDSSHSPFTGEPILFWSESSGTTGRSKVYPITHAYQKEFQTVNGPFLYGVLRNNPTFLRNSALYFASTDAIRTTKNGIGVGFISGYNYKNIPALFKTKYALPDEVFRDRETFFRWGALYALSRKIDTFIAITPSIVQRFIEEITENRSFYLSQIANPRVPDGFPSLKFKTSEIERLQRVLGEASITIKDLWPTFQTLICWKSATCGLQLQALKTSLGASDVVDAIYSATEGWMTVPTGGPEVGGALHCAGHVYEFIEVGREITEGNLIKPWELKTGHRYEIFLTTSMGFIRFRLRDILLCKGFLDRAPILEFLEKEGQAISLGQTRVSETHVANALRMSPLTIRGEWFLCPSDKADGLLLVTSDLNLTNGEVSEFDLGLRKANPEYDEDRRDRLLQPLAIKSLPLIDTIWSKDRHAQSKPRVIVQLPPSQWK
jgi:hypothetical protein